MSKQNWIYFSFIFLIANLFFQESFGLNAAIGSIVFIVLQGIRFPAALRNTNWWLSAFLLLLTAAGLLISQNTYAYLFFPLNLLLFANAHTAVGNSILHKGWAGLLRFATGFYYPFSQISLKLNQKKEEKIAQKFLIRFLVYGLPILIALIFLKLYQSADATFYEWTKFINLDWVSWDFILFYFLLTFFLFGLYYITEINEVKADWERKSEYVKKETKDKLTEFMGSANELKLILSLLISLNILLFFFNLIDFQSLLGDHTQPTSVGMSLLVHKGVYALITSIVLVIFILGFVFRGALNFTQNKWVKRLAFIWIMQNGLLIGSTLIKNYDYITYYGLTGKRIGVMIYLLLALIGLIVFILKIHQKRSLWFTVRTMLTVFFTCFSLLSLVDFKEKITEYNLQHISGPQLDIEYLMQFGGTSLVILEKYGTEHPEFVSTYPEEFIQIKSQNSDQRGRFRAEQLNTSWRSWTWYKHKIINK